MPEYEDTREPGQQATEIHAKCEVTANTGEFCFAWIWSGPPHEFESQKNKIYTHASIHEGLTHHTVKIKISS